MPTPKITIVTDTKIVPAHSNGARNRTIIFLNEKKEQFKIEIHNQSYDFQSYARLLKWTEQEGFKTIHCVQPERDYKINISYQDKYPQTAFDPIVKDLMEISKAFAKK